MDGRDFCGSLFPCAISVPRAIATARTLMFNDQRATEVGHGSASRGKERWERERGGGGRGGTGRGGAGAPPRDCALAFVSPSPLFFLSLPLAIFPYFPLFLFLSPLCRAKVVVDSERRKKKQKEGGRKAGD